MADENKTQTHRIDPNPVQRTSPAHEANVSKDLTENRQPAPQTDPLLNPQPEPSLGERHQRALDDANGLSKGKALKVATGGDPRVPTDEDVVVGDVIIGTSKNPVEREKMRANYGANLSQ